jgi:hypothetical protein
MKHSPSLTETIETNFLTYAVDTLGLDDHEVTQIHAQHAAVKPLLALMNTTEIPRRVLPLVSNALIIFLIIALFLHINNR